ncbi:uncharacterized protein [Procambarus clarkii]|uniref:uncharacterized protein n=1 Tax=Procambarus clarkii TaxID=6728 RepID=UPI001E67846E|nr:uncharacterized protein LOC123755952 [Procambarus clarkii]
MIRRSDVMGCLWVATCLASALAITKPVEDDSQEKQVLPGEEASPYVTSRLLPSYSSDSSGFWPLRGKRPPSGDLTTAGRRTLVMGSDGAFWLTRGKKAYQGHQPFYWGSNQDLWGETPYTRKPGEGAEEVTSLRPPSQFPTPGDTKQSSRGKRDSGGPFWVSRGKKDGGPFWVARGKRVMGTDLAWGANPWIMGMRSQDVDQDDVISYLSSDDIFFSKREGGGPFWTSRGKKPAGGGPGGSPPLWVSRVGKSSGDKTFWVARGKKEAPHTHPFWISRGKRDDANITSFWVARGKKAGESHPFWIARGKADHATHPFWERRGKDEPEGHPLWITRGKKEVKTKPFWVSREESDGAPYWVSGGRREDQRPSDGGGVPVPRTVARDSHEDPVMAYLLQVLAEGQNDTVPEDARSKTWL